MTPVASAPCHLHNYDLALQFGYWSTPSSWMNNAYTTCARHFTMVQPQWHIIVHPANQVGPTPVAVEKLSNSTIRLAGGFHCACWIEIWIQLWGTTRDSGDVNTVATLHTGRFMIYTSTMFVVAILMHRCVFYPQVIIGSIISSQWSVVSITLCYDAPYESRLTRRVVLRAFT